MNQPWIYICSSADEWIRKLWYIYTKEYYSAIKKNSFESVQFSRSVMTLCDPMNCSMPVFSVYHQLPEPAQIHVHWVSDAVQPFCSLLSPCLQSFPSGSFPLRQVFASGGQNSGASSSASVLPMNIQGWFPLGLTGVISLQSKSSQGSSSTPQFKSINYLAFSLL